jgi:hypothetical protein
MYLDERVEGITAEMIDRDSGSAPLSGADGEDLAR